MGSRETRETQGIVDRRLYGRRQGHKLKTYQASLVDKTLPKISINLPGDGALDPSSLFEAKDEVWLEIGFGGGEHLAAQAMANPKVGFVGCEFYINGIAKLLSQADKQDLKNIRLYTEDSRDLLPRLKPNSISRAFLLFPDPWPKKRHNKRRYISPQTLDDLACALKPGAEFRVATDIPDYCRWTLAHICRHKGFEWAAEGPQDWRQRPIDWPLTRYEAKAVREGRTPVYLSFIRR